MSRVLERLCGRSKRKADTISVNSERRRDLGASYVEHRLNLDQLRDIFVDSYIDSLQPEQSDGLSVNEAAKRIRDGGPNRAVEQKGPSGLNLFLNQNFYKFWILLLAASLLSIVTYVIRSSKPEEDAALNLTTAFILIPVILVMSGLSLWQERRTRATMEINQSTPQSCTVIRDSENRLIPAEQLVVGDLVWISAGQKVPADCRMLQTNSLKIDNSSILGRADPVDYTHEAVAENVSVFEARNVCFQGTFCVEGDGIGLVIKTGQFTFLGNMTDISWAGDSTSLLRRDLKETVDIITFVSVLMAAAFFAIGVLVSRFENVHYFFIVGFLVIIVANVPQGLPCSIMFYLAIMTKRLRSKSIFIKNLDSVDELGAATLIAVAKSGILTQNQLTVTDLWFNQQSRKVNCENAKNKPKHMRPKSDEQSKTLDAMHAVIGVSSRVWRRGIAQHSVRRARAASLVAAARRRRESGFQPQRRKLFTVIHQTGEESIRSPDDYKRGTIMGGDDLLELDPSELIKSEKNESLESVFAESPAHSKSKCEPTSRNSSDDALRRYVQSIGASPERLGRHFKPIYEIPYSSNRRWQIVVCRCLSRLETPLFPQVELEAEEAFYCVMLKGAPEVVLDRSEEFFDDEAGIRPIDDSFKEKCLKAWQENASNGNRSIAFAIRFFIAPAETKFSAAERNFPDKELVFLGMAALRDPARADTAEAVRQCAEAGIKLLVVTGDHPRSVLSFGQRVGMIPADEATAQMSRVESQIDFTLQSGRTWAIVHGRLLSSMTQQDWDSLLAKQFVIFARTTPEQASAIVEACQAREEIIAYAGNTVSDAPALLEANVGIASSNGTDVAVKAADIVIGEESLSSILTGVQAGRILFENLQLSIAYTLAHLFPEVFPIILNFTCGFPLGLAPIQILSIDLACELPPAIALAYEKPERDIMKCPPRQKRNRLVNAQLLLYSYGFIGVIIAAGCLAAYCSVYLYNGVSADHLFFHAGDFWHGRAENLTDGETGVTYNAQMQMEIRGQASAAWQITLVVGQFFHLFMCTTRRVSLFRHGITSWAVVFATSLELILLVVFVYTPFMQPFLGIHPPPWFVWLFGVGVGVCILAFTEFRKHVLRSWSKELWLTRVFDW
ncbi:Cation-ATPase-N domain-containing protein [Aphelenchoides fujianensis]|nr:Cation-ATPase-N domain-containing protein [Aphelenchoides fujianensis]